MMRTLHSILVGAVLAVAGYTATAQAQEKPEDKPPINIWQAAAKGDVEAIKGFLAKDNKIGAIKAVREIKSDLGLVEAKELVEKAPVTLLEKAKKEDAEEAKKKLEDAGVKVELK